MTKRDRLEQITDLVDESGFLSVGELSTLLGVSEMTIRRDLSRLDQEHRIQRTYGGAASLRARMAASTANAQAQAVEEQVIPLSERVDVLITTALNPKYDGLLLEIIDTKKTLPIIAESLSTKKGEPVVTVENFTAGSQLGRWAANYAVEHWDGDAYILDLTYYLANTQARSQGFLHGVREVLPDASLVLSLDAQSRYDTAYQLTHDALSVHPHINIIFAINDITAWGAINACKDLGIDREKCTVLPFGLEGDTLKDAIQDNLYCKAGLAMFPEIVGKVCMQAAISAYNLQSLPDQIITPHAVLTEHSLDAYYDRAAEGWNIRWQEIDSDFELPDLPSDDSLKHLSNLPHRVGFIVPFSEHEWYKSLVKTMRAYAGDLGIEFEIIDVHQSLNDEVEFRRREIASVAAQMIQPDDVVLLDGGSVAVYLAEALLDRESITVITNAIPVFETLRSDPNIVLILIGGAYRKSSQMLVGPTAEGALRELRVDKLFLNAAGVSLDFGLSHTSISEVTIKQAMIRSAREVILLADHTLFGQESTIQLASLNMIDKLITDDALPASIRLELTKMGIEIVLANT
jgi:DeoR/GlpR family transcriptional regulator of sugar metabolism